MRWLATIPKLNAWALGVVLSGCAAHTGLEPLPAGRLAPHASLGGPVVAAFGTRVPIPYLTAGADYGLVRRLNLSANAHLLPLAYGIAGLDAALVWFPWEGRAYRPTVGLEARFMAFASLKGEVDDHFIGYPVFSASAAWRLGSGLVYAGSHLAGPVPKPQYDPNPERFLWSPFLGYRWALGERYALLTELKWHGANIRSDQLAVSYLHPVGRGALTPMVAVTKRF